MPRHVSSAAEHAARPASHRELRAPQELSITQAMEEVRESKRGQVPSPWDSTRFLANAGLRANERNLRDAAKGFSIPWNWRCSGGSFGPAKHWASENWINESRGRYLPREKVEEVLREESRQLGWVRAVQKFPALHRLLQKTQNGRGSSSPYYTGHLLGGLMKMSPGKACRRVCAVRYRANKILDAYAGKPRVSNLAIGQAVITGLPVGKAAVMAVALTLRVCSDFSERVKNPFHSYKQARAWLVEHRSAAFPIRDTTDGVAWNLQASPEMTKLGIEVYKGVSFGPHGRRKLVQLVHRKADGRTWHSDNYCSPAERQWNGKSYGRNLVSQAVEAWRKQDGFAAKNRDVIAFLKGDELGFCPIIIREDSYRAGNCEPGTEAFLKSKGWSGKEFIPGILLVSHLDDPRVVRVVQAAREACAS